LGPPVDVFLLLRRPVDRRDLAEHGAHLIPRRSDGGAPGAKPLAKAARRGVRCALPKNPAITKRRGFRMPEHTIPESLIENIRSGRAVLVVGVGIGIPSWKQVLERMNQALRERGGAGDDAASRDVEKLLHKGSLLRAAGFLGRTLGEEACDR